MDRNNTIYTQEMDRKHECMSRLPVTKVKHWYRHNRRTSYKEKLSHLYNNASGLIFNSSMIFGQQNKVANYISDELKLHNARNAQKTFHLS